MRAAFCRGVGRLVVQDVPRPTPGPGEVLVRVRNCGICGSDLHWYHDQMMIPSVCPGHALPWGRDDADATAEAGRRHDMKVVEVDERWAPTLTATQGYLLLRDFPDRRGHLRDDDLVKVPIGRCTAASYEAAQGWERVRQ